MLDNKTIAGAMTIKLDNTLPEYPEFEEGRRRAPDRGFRLTEQQARLALKTPFVTCPKSSMKPWRRNSWRSW